MDALKILLIDDDPMINYLNKRVIEKAEIEASICDQTRPEEALTQLSNGQISPNIILLDLNMPNMNGWEFLHEYEQLPKSSQKSKIIILSSTINPTDKQKAATSASVSAFLSKPLSIDDAINIRNTFNAN